MNAPERLHALDAPPHPGGERWTVLCVDDEPNILAALKRMLRGAGYTVFCADGADEALEHLGNLPVDAVISDMRMPGMDGAQLLQRVHEGWPQVLRVLLTGHADMEATVAAINRGRILRYLSKPWDEHELLGVLREGLERVALEREARRLQALTEAQNRELQQLNAELDQRVQARTTELADANQRLQRNHLKTIKVFSNLLELRGGEMAGHGRRVAETARDIARAMGWNEVQALQVFVAGLLHDIGLIGVGASLSAKAVRKLSAEELQQYQAHAAAGEHSLMALDDLQPVLPMIRGHHERWDGDGYPDRLAGDAIPVGARILAVADAYDDLQQGQLVESRLSPAEARTILRQLRGKQFDPEVLDVFLHITEPAQPKAEAPPPPPSLLVPSAALEADMVLARDLVSTRGVLMLTAGHRLTPSLIRRIREFEQREGGQLQIHILVKTAASGAAD